MDAVKFSWSTVFDTANNLMIHTFFGACRGNKQY